MGTVIGQRDSPVFRITEPREERNDDVQCARSELTQSVSDDTPVNKTTDQSVDVSDTSWPHNKRQAQ